MTEQITMIPARLKNAAVNGHVAGAADIIDDAKAKTQDVINQDVDTAIGDDDVEGSIKGRIKALEEAVGPGGSVEEQIDAKVATLDASVSQTAGADGLALSVTEVDGIVTSVSGSIAANTYDAYGSASAEATRAQGAESTLQGNIDAEETRAKGAEGTIATNLSNEITRAQGAEQQNASDIDAIETKIPTQASSTNQLADKEFVNSSISTSTATFRGTSAAGLSEADFLAWANALTKDANDYVFWNTTDAAGNVQFKRYKYNGTTWEYEYTLNNSSFTSEQWAAIQSGITSALTTKLTALPTNAELTETLASKQAVISDLDTIRSGAAAGATAYQKPSTGIPSTDLTSAAQTSLGKADTAVQPADLATVATSGSYNDLTDKPSIPSGQVQSDWNQTVTSEVDYIKNKPTIPVVPTNVSAFTNDAGYLTQHQSLDNYYTKTQTNGLLDDKQDTLVSGTNIKTINSQSLLGSGNITITGNTADVNYDTTNKKITKTINGVTSDVVTAETLVTDGGAAIEPEVEIGETAPTGTPKLFVDEDADPAVSIDIYNKTQVDTLLANKVDKVIGKGLSTNDFDNTSKGKLDDLPSTSEAAASGGTDLSLVTTGEKYNYEDKYTKTQIDALTRHTRLTDFDLSVLKQAVAEGNLEKYGLKVGDEKTINGRTYVIADLNTMKGTTTPQRVNTNHVGLIVIPHVTQKWNAGGKTYEGADERGAGYANCDLHYYLVNTLLPLVKTDLGATNLISHNKLLTNAFNTTGYNRRGSNTGCSSNWGWSADQYISALSEVQVYGGTVWSSSGYDTGEACKQLDVFRHYNHTEIFGGELVWLRDVVDVNHAAFADNEGLANSQVPSIANYVAALILFH